MKPSYLPSVHPDPWVDLTRGYIARAAQSLTESGLTVEKSWLDPREPRDATIVFRAPASGAHALVWDEVSGWRCGIFGSGRPGVRTVLSGVRYLGGGVLPDVRELVHRVLAGVSEPHRQYRSLTDLDDGTDDELRQYLGLLAAVSGETRQLGAVS